MEASSFKVVVVAPALIMFLYISDSIKVDIFTDSETPEII